MFSIEPNPTFKASLVIVGQGREQTLNVVYRHKPRSEYIALLEKVRSGDVPVADALLQLVESWDADAPLEAGTIEKLQEAQPGVDWAIVSGYTEALTVARKGN
ncbi:MAG TPA: phage tail assembly chaperone [Rhodanobacteraceae bacterium]|nr:phage tail assembly chaperone [Rhodanobacteraceae bacterium]